jgi:hypothetical protein
LLQFNGRHAPFVPGNIPVFRKLPALHYCRPDDTIFFPLSVLFLLRRLEKYLSSEEISQIKLVLPHVKQQLYLYKNKDTEPSYNFWKTRPSAHWPFGNFAQRFRFFQIPDDIDDSALALSILDGQKTDFEALRNKMLRYANVNVGKNHPHTFSVFRNRKIYNTFFIKSMPSSFDFCALSNVMLLFHEAGLKAVEEDADSIFFLRQSILNRHFLDRSWAISPYYPDSAIILYHAVRARGCLFSDAEQADILLPLLQDVFASCRRPVQKMMLASSLMKMGVKPEDVSIPDDRALDNFVFFVAGLFGEFHSPWIRLLDRLSFTQVKYHCRTFSDALLFEYLILKRSHETVAR